MDTNGKQSQVILLVDDDPTIICLLSTYLRRKGHEVAAAANAAEALAIFEQSPESVGVLVSDVHMPGMSGVELAELLESRNCPVMLISGKPFPPEARERGWKLLPKPFLPSALLETAEQVMSDAHHEDTAQPRRLRVILAEDNATLRQRLSNLLNQCCDVLAALEDGDGVLERAADLHPDLILLDIDMPRMNGFAVARALRDSLPGVPIVFVTQHAERAYVEEAFRAGGAGYVLKGNVGRELNEALEQVRSGGRFLSPELQSSQSV